MAGVVTRLLRKGRAVFSPRPASDFAYWNDRARSYGQRAVLHLGHTTEEIPAVTHMQERELFPRLQALLTGSDQMVLDYGCGPGRFTPGLARLVGRAIGVDPTPAFIAMAPPDPRVEYRQLVEGRIPLPDASVDVVWSAIVLGCITRDDALHLAVAEMKRVLRPGGLLFLAENTSQKPDGPHFIFRTVETYQTLFQPIPLRGEGAYMDLDETITALAGRSAPA